MGISYLWSFSYKFWFPSLGVGCISHSHTPQESKLQIVTTFFHDNFSFTYLKLLLVPPLTSSQEPWLVLQAPSSLFCCMLILVTCFMISYAKGMCWWQTSHQSSLVPLVYHRELPLKSRFSFLQNSHFHGSLIFICSSWFVIQAFLWTWVLILWVNLLQFRDHRYGCSYQHPLFKTTFSVLS